jgi:hypothetical protein
LLQHFEGSLELLDVPLSLLQMLFKRSSQIAIPGCLGHLRKGLPQLALGVEQIL